jgi:hypothetical protein
MRPFIFAGFVHDGLLVLGITKPGPGREFLFRLSGIPASVRATRSALQASIAYDTARGASEWDTRQEQ